ncbi:hypothetical protein STCU_04834 [Strigomonas culicis]|uniref:LsmAD domain-containing protein n=1 Tax=Strigomonas culicis TaxID=28005 RepID=S9UDI1_9TRYP|nr:hypothetical protein STCU_04834 [Strigomonas culicis]|eukprot:EPY28882.1 hypothetical protein STCU_04834 [Strigomonas culicis]
MAEVDHSSNEDRLEYLYLNLVGQLVRVHTVDGTITEGIFVSRMDAEDAEKGHGVYISQTRYLASGRHRPLDPSQIFKGTKLFLYADIVMVEATHIRLRTEAPGGGHTHTYREHDLKQMDWAEEGTAELLEGGEKHEWDQFKANERFGVRSTYNEDIYTTKLDRNAISKEEAEFAENIARQIEAAPVQNFQHALERGETMPDDIDEGTLFSDVARTKKPQAPRAKADKAAAKRRGVEENPPLPIEGHQKDFNPAAAPFVPPNGVINDFLRTIAEAIENNVACYQAPSAWPGEEPQRDDAYAQSPPPSHQHYAQPAMYPHGASSQPPQQQQQQPLPPPPQQRPFQMMAPQQGSHPYQQQNMYGGEPPASMMQAPPSQPPNPGMAPQQAGPHRAPPKKGTQVQQPVSSQGFPPSAGPVPAVDTSEKQQPQKKISRGRGPIKGNK